MTSPALNPGADPPERLPAQRHRPTEEMRA